MFCTSRKAGGAYCGPNSPGSGAILPGSTSISYRKLSNYSDVSIANSAVSEHQPQYCITYQRHRKMLPQREAPFCAWYRGHTFSHCKDSRCLQKANAYTHTCTYKSSLNNSHHVLWPQQNTQTRGRVLDPPLPMPLHIHEALGKCHLQAPQQ